MEVVCPFHVPKSSCLMSQHNARSAQYRTLLVYEENQSHFDIGHIPCQIWFRIWENGTNILEKYGKSWLQPHERLHSAHEKLYIFGKVRSSPFQKYTVPHSHHRDTHLTVVKISPIFPKLPRMLVPLSLIRNHLAHITIFWYGPYMGWPLEPKWPPPGVQKYFLHLGGIWACITV